jgi:hypothetical protein
MPLALHHLHLGEHMQGGAGGARPGVVEALFWPALRSGDEGQRVEGFGLTVGGRAEGDTEARTEQGVAAALAARRVGGAAVAGKIRVAAHWRVA